MITGHLPTQVGHVVGLFVDDVPLTGHPVVVAEAGTSWSHDVGQGA